MRPGVNGTVTSCPASARAKAAARAAPPVPRILALTAPGVLTAEGRHIRFDKPTPLANVHLTLLERVGVRLDKFGDSDGLVGELAS